MKIASRRSSSGFSLIELMVALVAGMIVVGSVIAYTVSSLRANTEFVKSTRLMQELRNVNDVVNAELKRAGYDEAAMDYVANPTATAASLFAPILVDTTANANCVVYAYDRSGGRPGKVDGDRGELRAIRRSTWNSIGVLEVAESTGTVTPACGGASPDYSQYPVSCNATSGWCPLSDPRVLNVATFAVTTTPVGTNSNGVQSLSGGPGLNALQMREFGITLAGNLVSDASITRSMRSDIKVRADCVRASVTPACTVAPQITP